MPLTLATGFRFWDGIFRWVADIWPGFVILLVLLGLLVVANGRSGGFWGDGGGSGSGGGSGGCGGSSCGGGGCGGCGGGD